jgi:WD40 repeat protein
MPNSTASDTVSSQPRHYAIFLSYRHVDNKQSGRQWATWLHQMLESYEVPPELVATPNSRSELTPASLYPVFRDEEELPADADLTRNIRQALEHSDLLVVICSPRAVSSRFVAEEIRYFKELGKSDRVLALVIDGEPNASDDLAKQAAGLTAALECFPEPLRFGVACPDGTVDWTTRTEPIAADARPEGQPVEGWTTGAAYREQLLHERLLDRGEIERKVRQYEERLELVKLKIVAGALSIPLGVLTQRDKATQLLKVQRRLRTIRRLAVSFLCLGLLTTLAALVAWQQRGAAKQETRHAEAARKAQVHALAMAFYDTALQLLGDAKFSQSLSYVAASLRLEPDNALLNRMAGALLLDVRTRLPTTRPIEGASAFSFDFTHDGRYALASWSDQPAELINLRSGRVVGPIKTGKPPVQLIGASFDPAGACAAVGMKSIVFWNNGQPAANEPTRSIWLGLSLGKVLLTGQGRNVIFTTANSDIEGMLGRFMGRSQVGQAKIIETETGAVRDRKMHDGTILRTAAIPGSDEFLTLGADNKLRHWTPDSETPIAEHSLASTGLSLAVSPQGNLAAAGGTDDKVTLVDLQSHQTRQLANIGGRLRAEAVAFNSDGSRVAVGFGQSGSHNGWIRIWETKEGLPTSAFSICDDWISHLAFNHDDRRIGYSCSEGLAGIVDGVTATSLAKWQAGAQSDFVQYVGDQDNFTVAVDQRSLQIYSDSPDPLLRWQIRCPARVRRLALDKSGKRAIVVLGGERRQHAWLSLEDGTLSHPPIAHSGGSIAQACLFDGGKEPFAVLLLDDGSIETWNEAGNLITRRAPPAGLDRLLQGAELPPEGLNFGSDAYYARSNPETLLIASTFVDREKWSALMNDVDQKRLDPRSSPEEAQRRMLSNFRGRIQLIDPGTLQPRWQVDYPAPLIYPRLSVGGNTLAAMDTRNAHLLAWLRNADHSWTSLPLPPPNAGSNEDVVAVTEINLSADGRWLLIDGNAALVCDLQRSPLSWQPLAPGQQVTSAVFSPGLLVALDLKSNDYSGIVQLWNIETRQPVSPKFIHGGAVNSMRFSEDGRLLVTASDDKLVRIWDVNAGRLAVLAFKTNDKINDARFLPGDHSVIFGGYDNTVSIIPLPPAERAPDWVPAILEAMCGSRIDEQGHAQAVSLTTAFEVRPSAQAKSTFANSWGAVGDWLWRQPQSRAPGLDRTRAQLLMHEALNSWEMNDHSLARVVLREALRADPNLAVPPKLGHLRDLAETGAPVPFTMEKWDRRPAGTAFSGPAGIRFRWCPPADLSWAVRPMNPVIVHRSEHESSFLPTAFG